VKILENRAVALLCALLLVIGSTAWNIERNLDRQEDALEQVWAAKYGIAEKLAERCSNASQLWSVLSRYSSLSDVCARLRSAYNALYDTDMDMDRAERLFTLNEELNTAAAEAMSAAEKAGLSSEDSQWAQRYYSNMTNAQRLMEQADYHQAQREFAQLLEAPHVRLLLPLIEDELPQKFA